MPDKEFCIWCGRNKEEVNKLMQGPAMTICDACISRLSGRLSSEEASLKQQVREEIDKAVQDSFQRMVANLDLGPLQEKYQKLVQVTFKEEPGSPTFQEVFTEFKKGVESEVERDDYQTRYDLAIAYHEMGLSEDAFREMVQSLSGALARNDFDRAGEIMSALLYFHQDSARVIRALHRTLSSSGLDKSREPEKGVYR